MNEGFLRLLGGIAHDAAVQDRAPAARERVKHLAVQGLGRHVERAGARAGPRAEQRRDLAGRDLAPHDAEFLIVVMQGGMLVTKVTRSPQSFRRAAAQALAHIRTLRRKA